MSISKNKSALQLSYEEFCPQMPPIVFLHGLVSPKETWKECAQHIARKTGSMVYYYDARNCGLSPWTESMSYEEMAEDLASFMDMRSIEKAVIVGSSMGGRTSLSFAAKYPERVICLILEDSTLDMFNSISVDSLLQTVQMRREIISSIPPEVDLPEAQRIIRSYFENKINMAEPSKSAELLKFFDSSLIKYEDGQFSWTKINWDVIINFIHNGIWITETSKGGYAGPVLVIYGTESQFHVLNDKENLLKHFPNTVYAAIEGGGHSLHTPFFDNFNQLVCDFIIKHR